MLYLRMPFASVAFLRTEKRSHQHWLHEQDLKAEKDHLDVTRFSTTDHFLTFSRRLNSFSQGGAMRFFKNASKVQYKKEGSWDNSPKLVVLRDLEIWARPVGWHKFLLRRSQKGHKKVVFMEHSKKNSGRAMFSILAETMVNYEIVMKVYFRRCWNETI